MNAVKLAGSAALAISMGSFVWNITSTGHAVAFFREFPGNRIWPRETRHWNHFPGTEHLHGFIAGGAVAALIARSSTVAPKLPLLGKIAYYGAVFLAIQAVIAKNGMIHGRVVATGLENEDGWIMVGIPAMDYLRGTRKETVIEYSRTCKFPEEGVRVLIDSSQ